jgi:hypothetical protein
MHDVVKRALVSTVTDIGQLTADERRALSTAVARGWIAKGRGGPYPCIKTVYALPGYDFSGERQRSIARLREDTNGVQG